MDKNIKKEIIHKAKETIVRQDKIIAEQDRMIGELTRKVNYLEDTEFKRNQWLSKAKKDAGF